MKLKTRKKKLVKTHETPKWELGYLEIAEKEGRILLTEEQYAHIVQLFEELSYDADPKKSKAQNVKKVFDFYELSDKGGLLGKTNIRAYFTTLKKGTKKFIIVLSIYKKEEEGKLPDYIVIRIKNRQRVAKEEILKLNN